MDQNEIASMFRQGELARREARLKVMANHAELESEPLTKAERKIDSNARKAMKEQHLRLEKSIRPGYFERLWAALWGR